jgi:hypothetical protein
VGWERGDWRGIEGEGEGGRREGGERKIAAENEGRREGN